MNEFKMCPCCKVRWSSYSEFKSDPEVFYIGLTGSEGIVLFFFIHAACRTTMTVSSNDLDKHFNWINRIFKKRDPRSKAEKTRTTKGG